MGLRGDPPPAGYRQLTRLDVLDADLRSRLVAEHQTRGGWGLTKDPLEFTGVLVFDEGRITINGNAVGMVGQDWNGTARGVYSVIDWADKVPWTTTPPAPKAW